MEQLLCPDFTQLQIFLRILYYMICDVLNASSSPLRVQTSAPRSFRDYYEEMHYCHLDVSHLLF